MLKVGDKVKLSGRDIIGEILKIRTVDAFGMYVDEFLVKYDADDLIPPQDWHCEVELMLYSRDLPVTNIKCECGVDSVMPNGKHSDYCPLYRK
jgi:hypothetical protein